MNIFENENGHKVYEIESMDDFLDIPADRLEDCLADFKVATDMIRPIYETANVVGALLGITESPMKQRTFQWIDDGIHGEAAAKACDITGIELPDGDNMVIRISSVQDEDS